MSSKKKSSRSSSGSGGNERRLAPSSGQGSPYNEGNLPSPARLHSTRADRVSRSRPQSSIPLQLAANSYSTPPIQKKSSSGGSNATPETIANTPSSFSSTDDMSPVFDGSPMINRTNLASLDNAGVIVVDMDVDEALARILDQEYRDAEFAARLEREERAQNLAQHRQAAATFVAEDANAFHPDRRRQRRRQEDNDVASSSSCRDKSIFYSIRLALFVVVTAVTLVVLVMIFGGPKAVVDPNTWMPGFPDVSNANDGFKMGEHNMWVSDLVDNGLNLLFLNNLVKGSDWNGYLRESVNDWDTGTPDSVTLKIKRVQYDPDCKPVRLAAKVCNGDYGPTDWRGLNQIVLANDYIVSSVAKMNDYYLTGTNREQKLYTMCHELGHALGLGHFDENFYNADQGNCMDYTERPENNMRPDESTFKVLQDLYGTVDHSDDVGSSRTVAVEDMLENNNDRRQLNIAHEEELFEKYATHFQVDPITVFDDNDGLSDNRGWRLLHRTENAIHHQKKLSDGVSIVSTILLA